jgi:hypothetical protein
MKQFVVLTVVTVLALGFGSCEKKPKEPSDLDKEVLAMKDTTLSTKQKYMIASAAFSYKAPITFGSTKNILVPMTLEVNEQKGRKLLLAGGGEYGEYGYKGYREKSRYGLANLCLVSPERDTAKVLFNRPVYLNDLAVFDSTNHVDYNDFSYRNEHQRVLSRAYEGLVFAEVSEYTPNFKRRKDERLLLVDVKNFTVSYLTPENTLLQSWSVSKNGTELFVSYTVDSNGNGKFDSTDDDHVSYYDFRDPSGLKPVLDQAILESLKEETIRNISK